MFHYVKKKIYIISLIISFILCFIFKTSLLYSEQYDIYVITISSNDALYTKWGHNGIRVYNKKTNSDLFYNYGNFAIVNTNSIFNFFENGLRYWLDVESYSRKIKFYHRQNRDIYLQKLNLTYDESKQFVNFLKENSKLENRFYDYHFVTNNCSTKIRDLINNILLGQLEFKSSQKGKLTVRDYIFKALRGDLFFVFLIDLIINKYSDRFLTKYEEMFIPENLRKFLDNFYFNRAGKIEKLVVESKWLYKLRNIQSIDYYLDSSNILVFIIIILLICGLQPPRKRITNRNFPKFKLGITLFFVGLFFVLVSLSLFLSKIYFLNVKFVGYNTSYIFLFLIDFFLIFSAFSYFFSLKWALRIINFWLYSKLLMIVLYLVFAEIDYDDYKPIYVFFIIGFFYFLVFRIKRYLGSFSKSSFKLNKSYYLK